MITLSAAARDALWRWLRVESRVIPPGVDLQRFTPGGAKTPEPSIVCPSALDDPRKRGGTLLAAFDLVRRERPETRLLLSRPSDANLARELATRPGVELIDLDGHQQLLECYRSAHVLALPSRAEAFGLVVSEALACGTPAVVSDDGGSAEIVQTPEIGLTVACDDVNALARGLLDGLDLGIQPDTPSACRNRAEDFSTDRTTDLHRDLYREMIDAR